MQRTLFPLLMALALLAPGAALPFDQAHAAWSRWLGVFTTDGKVAYGPAKKEPDLLRAYLSELGKVSGKEFASWSQDERKAYWINLYNAATVDLVVEHYPVQSIKKIGFWWRGPWKKRIGNFAGKVRTLDEIEHQILRKEFPDSRTHAALVCASRSCPKLRSEAYRGEGLSAQLDRAMEEFLGDPERNRVDERRREIRASRIFDWYEADFVRDEGSILELFRRRLPPDLRAKVSEGTWRITFLDYDWALNDLVP